jgi:hypothetical protein
MTQIDTTVGSSLARLPGRRSAAEAKPETVAQALNAFSALAVLRDRGIPGRRGSLDWLVVGSFGVFVVDEHAAEGDRAITVRLRPSSGQFGPWTVVANGQDHPRALSGAQSRAEVVQEALEAAGIVPAPPVGSVVCFNRASLPPMRRQLRLGPCVVAGLPGLTRLLRTSGPLTADDQARVVAALDAAFPPASPELIDGLVDGLVQLERLDELSAFHELSGLEGTASPQAS